MKHILQQHDLLCCALLFDFIFNIIDIICNRRPATHIQEAAGNSSPQPSISVCVCAQKIANECIILKYARFLLAHCVASSSEACSALARFNYDGNNELDHNNKFARAQIIPLANFDMPEPLKLA